MSDINQVVLVGRLGSDPDYQYFQNSDAKKASFSIAVNKSRKNPQTQKWEDVPNWFKVEIWGNNAEYVSKYARKGSLVTVQGELKQNRWVDSTTGKEKSTVIINANNISIPKQGSGSTEDGDENDIDDMPF